MPWRSSLNPTATCPDIACDATVSQPCAPNCRCDECVGNE